MSPTTIFIVAAAVPVAVAWSMVPRGGVPGVWDDGWVREGLYRVLPTSHPRTHI